MNITPSQQKVIQQELDLGHEVRISGQCEFSSRLKVWVRVTRFLAFYIYIGKRGKVFSTESGDF